jgi:hypothetical protein
MSDLSNDTKKHTTKSRETIPLTLFTSIVYRYSSEIPSTPLCNYLYVYNMSMENN